MIHFQVADYIHSFRNLYSNYCEPDFIMYFPHFLCQSALLAYFTLLLGLVDAMASFGHSCVQITVALYPRSHTENNQSR